MMSLYTMELRTLVNDPFCPIFDFDYPFYTDDPKAKEEFENLFINHFYYHEIGCETFTRWKHMLKSRLMLKMPYYQQLYQTEWNRLKSAELMLTAKNLTETTTHEYTQTGEITGSSETTATNNISDTSSSHANATGEGKESSISDGVQMVNLEKPNLTAMNQSTSNTSSESTSQSEAESGSSSTSTSQNQTSIKETTTHTSIGDVGIQTPAYGITEWRKIIININEMLIHDLESLFIQIY